MPARSNADIIRIVTKWQGFGFVHELTCRVDSRHAALVAIERHGKVVLDCPTCGATQDEIPEAVLNSEATIDYALGLEVARLKREELRQTRSDIRLAYGIGLIGGILFGNFWFGAVGALAGGALGTATAWLTTRRDRKKLSRP